MNNIKRVSNLVSTILSTVEFLESTWSWQNKALSIFSMLVSVGIIAGYNYYYASRRGILKFHYLKSHQFLWFHFENFWDFC